jgi:hypothetical protein
MSSKKNTSVHDSNDRKFSGVTATTLYKSREEAPEVGTYDYDNVNVVAYDGGSTDLNDFNNQWTSTLFGGVVSNVQMPEVDIDTLLNDAMICIRIDDGTRLLSILESIKTLGYSHPADVEFGEMFRGTLWGRTTDPDFQISDEHRETTLQLLSYFHTTNDTTLNDSDTSGGDGQ